MKIVYINTFSDGSTGRICSNLGKFAASKGDEVLYFYGREYNPNNTEWTYIGQSGFKLFASRILTYVTGKIGSFYKTSTKKMLEMIDKISPDVIHVHNIHGNFVNFKMLFDYLKKSKAKVIITLHDEFLATGRCAYIPNGCNERCNQCKKCKFKDEYPRTLIDKSHKLFLEKIALLDGFNATYVSPSKWLQGSFLSSKIGEGKNCIVINNGFPVENVSKLKKEKGDGKIKLLAAAFEWSELKGRHILAKLVDLLDLDKYELTVVGGIQDNYKFPTKINYFPKMSKEELAKFYANSDLFIMPTFNDNFPTVLIESLCYGLPIISFDSGGCKEIVGDCGVMVKDRTAESLAKAINEFDFNKYTPEKCKERSKQFSLEKMLEKYYEVYTSK